MRFPFICSLILSLAACTDSELHLETSYDLELTLEGQVCDGNVQLSVHEAQGALSVTGRDAPDTFDLAFEIFVIPEASIDFQLRNIPFNKGGYFEGWSQTVIDRGEEIFVPFFHFMEGSATTEGFEARYTVYMSDDTENQSTPVCRYIWQVRDR